MWQMFELCNEKLEDVEKLCILFLEGIYGCGKLGIKRSEVRRDRFCISWNEGGTPLTIGFVKEVFESFQEAEKFFTDHLVNRGEDPIIIQQDQKEYGHLISKSFKLLSDQFGK
jgi:hypothetical protein